jgi:GNAT superfamily N-acetyltransferase
MTSPVLVTRAPQAGDANDLALLLAQLGYPADAQDIPDRLAAFDSNPAAYARVAVSEGHVVGLATAHVIRSLHKSEVVAMLTVLVVDERARGKGVGRMMVHEAEEWAVRCGASAISLTSALRRTGAHDFYRQLGYEHTGVRLAKVLTPSPAPASIGHHASRAK